MRNAACLTLFMVLGGIDRPGGEYGAYGEKTRPLTVLAGEGRGLEVNGSTFIRTDRK